MQPGDTIKLMFSENDIIIWHKHYDKDKTGTITKCGGSNWYYVEFTNGSKCWLNDTEIKLYSQHLEDEYSEICKQIQVLEQKKKEQFEKILNHHLSGV